MGARRTRVLIALLAGAPALLASCEAPAPVPDGLALESGAIRQGDPCEGSSLTLRCSSPGPLRVAGRGEVCATGTRRCRDGAWSACEDLRFEPAPGRASVAGTLREEVIGSPVICGGCDPACYITRDDPTDLDDGDSRTGFDGVEHDPVAGGLVIAGPGPLPPDADGDGLPDASDPTPADFDGDFDGDGVPDAWEALLGRDPSWADPPPAVDEWYVVLPYEAGPVSRTIPPGIPLEIRRADIYFLVDTTGSMGGEISNLRASLTTYVIPEIRARIGDPWFGVGQYRDYLATTVSGAMPYRNVQDLTDDAALAQAAINTLAASGGADYPESATAALHAIATGHGLSCGPPDRVCAGGRIGYPCFRPDALPIVVLVTDNSFHNGVGDTLDTDAYSGSSCYEYDWGCTSYPCLPLAIPCPSLETVVSELNAIGAKVIGVWSGFWPGSLGQVQTWTWGRTYPDFDEVIDLYYTVEQTGSVDGSGHPFLYGISPTGSGLDVEVVNAVDDLVSTMLLDVGATWRDPDGVPPDSALLVEDVEPTSCSMCASIDSATNTAYGVHPGSDVTFTVTLSNDTGEYPTAAAPQTVDVLVEITDGTSVLATRLVHVLVPGAGPLPPASGSYTRLYDSAFFCVPPDESYRTRLYFEADTPDTTSIRFYAETADPPDAIDGSPEVFLGETPPATPYVFVATPLETAGPPSDPRARLLSIRAELLRNGSAETPVLRSMTLEEYCD